MIGLGHWLAFVTASLFIAFLPGPGVANIVGYAVSSGRRTAFAAIAGAVAGNLVAMTLSLAGAGALLEAFPVAYKILELLGAAYLIGLGLIAIFQNRQPAHTGQIAQAAILPRTAFAGSIAVSALNQKSIIFFVAFVPQFISFADSYLVQSLTLVVTFALIVAISDTLYALLALRVADLLQSSVTAMWVRRAAGGVLIATGLIAGKVGWFA